MPSHIKKGFKSKNGMVTYGMGGSKKKAMYGYGGSMKQKRMMAKAGKELKEIPADNKGLGKLPKEVRNNMGYMQMGGSNRKMKKYPGGGSAMMGMPEERMKRQMYGMKMGGSKKKMIYGGMSKKKRM